MHAPSDMKLLNPRVHGIIDYLAVALLGLAPSLLRFAGTPAMICYVLAIAHLAMSLLTAYPLGAKKLIPFTIHGAIELGVAIFLVVSPWLFRFDGTTRVRDFFIASGIGLGLVYLLTNYRAADLPYAGEGRPRHVTPREVT